MMENKKLFYGILVIVVLAITGISLFVLNRPSIIQPPKQTPIEDPSKYCITSDDCVPVGCRCHCSGCGGFSYEDIVNTNYVDKWYEDHNCSPAMECPSVCCSPVFVACENNTCLVKPRTRENIPKELLEKEAIDKELCKNTGGAWIRDEIWVGQCQCVSLDYFEYGRNNFIDGRGCISQRMLCEENNGIWEKPRKVYFQAFLKSPDGSWRPVTENDCKQIPNSIWRENERDCMVYDDEKGEYADPNPKCVK